VSQLGVTPDVAEKDDEVFAHNYSTWDHAPRAATREIS
jgi:hypothetical protein